MSNKLFLVLCHEDNSEKGGGYTLPFCSERIAARSCRAAALAIARRERATKYRGLGKTSAKVEVYYDEPSDAAASAGAAAVVRVTAGGIPQYVHTIHEV